MACHPKLPLPRAARLATSAAARVSNMDYQVTCGDIETFTVRSADPRSDTSNNRRCTAGDSRPRNGALPRTFSANPTTTALAADATEVTTR